MYKIMVVDDEIWFREGIKSSIQWNKYDAEIIGDARDGAEALEVIECERPNIVFADIRMPAMDGLELTAAIKEKYPNIKVIIVSGYEDFEYARKAMSLGVSYYLTKPVDVDQLICIVNKVKHEIEKEKEECVLRQKIDQQLRESLPLLREKFLNNLINGEIKKVPEIKSKLGFLNIPLQLRKYLVFVLDIEYHKQIFSEQQEMDEQLVRFAVYNIVDEILQSEKDILIFNRGNNSITGIATFNNQANDALINIRVSKLFTKFMGLVQKFLKVTLTIGASKINNNWEKINEAYQQAMDAVKCKLIFGKGQAIFYHDINVAYKENIHLNFIDREELLDALKLCDMDKVKNILNVNLDELREKSYIEIDRIQQIYLRILGDITNFADDMGASENIFKGNPFKKLLNLSTIEDINSWLINICSKITELIISLREERNMNTVQKVIEYINNNYSKDISLNSAAEHVSLSPAYLSRLFKKEVKKSFIQCVMEERLKKAKELLCNTDKKMYEIANEVGYSDMRYFTKMFKSLEGITPSQYREQF